MPRSHAQRVTGLSLAIASMAFVLVACGAEQSASPDASGTPRDATASATPNPSAPAPSASPPAAYDPDAILLRFDATPDSIVDPWGDPHMDGIGTGSLWYLPGPDFTLYGDGTVIYRNDEAELAAGPDRDGRSIIGPALRTAQLSQTQVQEVLDFAWDQGGLADALPAYFTGAVDLITSGTFELSAGDRHKRVFIHGLFPDPTQADPEGRLRLLRLADYLRTIDVHLDIQSEAWTPHRFWAHLNVVDTSFVGPPENEWPWPHIQPEGWVGGRRSLLPSEVAALGLGPVPGGYCCALVSGPGGDDRPFTGYGIALTPALPAPLAVESVADVVTNDLVVRTAPGTPSDSRILDGRLDAPQLLYVTDGPVAADGFDWYLVQPFSYDYLPAPPVPAGWVAAGSREGEPWIAPRGISCLDDLESIVRLSSISRLACFGDREISLEGIHGDCFANDPGDTDPAWLLSSGCALLPSGYDTGVTPSPGALLMRIQDLDGHSSSLGGTRVYVTGHFDDPAAAGCTPPAVEGATPLPAELAELSCRTEFVITSISD